MSLKFFIKLMNKLLKLYCLFLKAIIDKDRSRENTKDILTADITESTKPSRNKEIHQC